MPIVSVPTLVTPTYFFPNQFIFDNYDPVNIDPRGAGSVNNQPSWKLFYLPFNITITRYRFQADIGTWTTGVFYAGLYTAAGNLVFDIGGVSLGSSVSGQYGPGAAHDPGTVFFDNTGTAKSSITLVAGWYLFAWSGSVATGNLVFPSMGSLNTTDYSASINVDTVGISPLVARWGTVGSATVSGGHLPATIGTVQSGVPTNPPNITFFA